MKHVRTGDGGRKAPELLGRVAAGNCPAGGRAEARGMPTLARAFENYLAANRSRAANTVRLYRQNLSVNLGDWLKPTLDTITQMLRTSECCDDRSWCGSARMEP